MDALISGRGGVAVVLDAGRLASLHAEGPLELVPRRQAELRYLLGEARDVEVVEGLGLEEIAGRLSTARDRELALSLALNLLDARLSIPLRREVAEELEELLARSAAEAGLENVLYAEPLPERADLAGAQRICAEVSAREVSELLERLREHQAQIREVREAWNAIPSALFEGESAPWQAAAVREGLFRALALLRAEGRNVNTFFVEAALNPAISRLPGSRGVLQQWIQPLASRAVYRTEPAYASEIREDAGVYDAQHKGRKRKGRKEH